MQAKSRVSESGIHHRWFIQAVLLIVSINPEVVDIASLSLKVSGVATLLAAAVGIHLGAFITLNEFPFNQLLIKVIYTLMGLPSLSACWYT